MHSQRKVFSLILVCTLLVGCFLFAGCGNTEATNPDVQQTERTVTDAAGREVIIPAEINKVYSTNPIGTMLVYTINPDKLAGWNTELRGGEKRFIAEKYQQLPVLGGWYAKTTGSVEELLKAKPDIIINVGETDESSIDFADKLQEQANIPVLILKLDLDKIDETYDMLGDFINEKEVTDKCAKYCADTLKDINDKAAKITEEQRVRVYYAEGPKGLNTDPAGSRHTQVLDMVKGINVAEVENAGKAGMAEVSLEQVLLWNPEVILCWNTQEQGGYFDGIMSSADWKNISAVKNNKVYETPCAPFCWFDRPPSVNRVLGLKWLGNLLYPEVYKYDMAKEVKEFYDLFYHYQLTDAEVTELLKNAQ
ncbi:MAG: ABC transporter substrate-binding protein [Clostridia bacterium]|nr:ABC transporter substrate-binding protein [Clostridia bacterium]